MKLLKKVVCAVACFALVAALAGCGSSDSKKDSKNSLTVKDGTLTMATNASFPPYEYVDGDKIVGIDAEVAQIIADKLGLKLEIVDVAFDSIIPGVQSGKYDMGMAGMTVTDKRKESVNFSDSYAKGIQAIIVPEGSDIKSVDDLEGKKIGAQQGTTGYIYASDTKENGGYGEENVTGFDNGAVAVEALKAGKVDCVIIDNEPAKAYVAANEGLKILDEDFANEDYAICFSKKNADLQKEVNAALKGLISDGSVKKVVDKYIKADSSSSSSTDSSVDEK